MRKTIDPHEFDYVKIHQLTKTKEFEVCLNKKVTKKVADSFISKGVYGATYDESEYDESFIIEGIEITVPLALRNDENNIVIQNVQAIRMNDGLVYTDVSNFAIKLTGVIIYG